MSAHPSNVRRLSTAELVESYLLDHLEGAWPATAPSVLETASALSPAIAEAVLPAAPVAVPEPVRLVVPDVMRDPLPMPAALDVVTPVDPDLLGVICFLVGPFRFLCPIDAVLDEPPEVACSVVIDAVELVPAPYRNQAAANQQLARDVVWLKGGRLEIRGCRLDASIAIRRSDLRSRGPRAEAPWIGATLRDPPAFFLDSDAMQLHFMRRLRVGD